MDPKTTTTTAPTSRVYLNPMFGKTHINPNFLKPQSILINPAFLVANQIENTPVTAVAQSGKIITKSKNKIVRETVQTVAPVYPVGGACRQINPLIKIGARKLVRASMVSSSQQRVASRSSESETKSMQHKTTVVPYKKAKYKIDRRIVKISPRKRPSFVSKYALSHLGRVDNLTPKRMPKMSRRVCRLEKTLNGGKSLLNINGVLYKSSKTKLEKAIGRRTILSSIQNAKTLPERVVSVRGNRFVLDRTGHSLKRLKTETDSLVRLKRIDIGGLTYVANSQGEFIRNNNHKTRNHLSMVKQKSINLLLKRLRKTNIPCPIFRKVGKCAAFERGKCEKVHDKKHVIICPRFLKGECISDKCLLSHAISLSKMPTCKFFLQGCCTRTDCPYLHKKLNEKTEICPEFLRGFCNLAEKCTKRHEFACPDFESKGKCERLRCPYEHPKNVDKKAMRRKNVKKKVEEIPVVSESVTTSRYFGGPITACDKLVTPPINDEVDATDLSREVVLPKRPKLGDLPAFIPL